MLNGEVAQVLTGTGVQPWRLLTSEPGVGVALFHVTGTIEYLNEAARTQYSGDAGAMPGLTLSGLLPREAAGELTALFQRVLTDRRPIILNRIYQGERVHATIWPCEPGRPHVVCISREGAVEPGQAGEGIEVVESAWIDLGPLDVLSPAELEVFVLLGQGLNVPRVARTLCRSRKTIERHKCSISLKLGLHGATELSIRAAQAGLRLEDVRRPRLGGKATRARRAVPAAVVARRGVLHSRPPGRPALEFLRTCGLREATASLATG